MTQSVTNMEQVQPCGVTEEISGVAVGKAARGVLVFYLLLFLLNVSALHEAIERRPFGPARAFWLRVTGPPAMVSRALRFDRPRVWMRQAVGEPLNR